MKLPELSKHYRDRQPSDIRKAQIEFSKRKDKNSINVINLAIGNISLPIYPSMMKRLKELGNSRFTDGVIKYTPSSGTKEAQKAFLNILSAEGIDTSIIFSMVTDGGSAAMELMLLGVCGPASEYPIMFLDPVYTNYVQFAKRLAIPTISTYRKIENTGLFSSLDLKKIESQIKKHRPLGILIIPYDNPTGQFLSQNLISDISKLAVKYNMWLISDEAYRPLYYKSKKSSTIWNINEKVVPGIKGRRISIESSSKVWNACGLRIGGLLTDNQEFYKKAVAEYTANLCANVLGQEVFGSLENESHRNIRQWYDNQRNYYKTILFELKNDFQNELPGIIVTEPESAIYFIIDFKNLVTEDFDTSDFTQFCAIKGKVNIDNIFYTILLAPMGSFYRDSIYGKSQIRIAIVQSYKIMKLVPKILAKLFFEFQNSSYL